MGFVASKKSNVVLGKFKQPEDIKFTTACSIPIFDQNGKELTNYQAIVEQDDQERIFKITTKQYQITQHKDIYRATRQALDNIGCKYNIIKTTDIGRRMFAAIDIPTIKHDVGRVGDIVNLRIGVTNSYDCSSGVRLDVYGHRLKCENGLFIAEPFSRFYSKHTKGLDIVELQKRIVHGIDIFTTKFAGVLEQYIEEDMSIYKAVQFIDQCKEKKIIPLKYLDGIRTMLENRTGVDTNQVNTKWDLYNTITEVITHETPSIFNAREFSRKIVGAMDAYDFAA